MGLDDHHQATGRDNGECPETVTHVQNKNENKKVQMLHKHPTTLWQLRSVAQLVPVFVSMDMVGQLDVPWLNCIPLGMDGE